jgi:hypothetical protein
VISDFRNVDEVCALLEYYAALNGNSVPTFRDNLSVLSSRVEKSKSEPMEMGLMGCPEMSVENYHIVLHNIVDERSSHAWGYRKLY